MKEKVITKQESSQKIEKYIRKSFPTLSLSLIYKLFRKKDIKVNGKPVTKDYVVKEGDVIRVYVVEYKEENNEFKPIKQEFKVVYEDENVLLVNKPEGLLVHEGDEGNDKNTLNKQVLSYLYEKGEYDPNVKGFTPSAAHRLDRNTSGLVFYGKTIVALQELFELFKDHNDISKYYLTLVKGKTLNKGVIEARLLKDEKSKTVRVSKNGAEAITKYRTLKSNNEFSLLEVELLTGRTHQIRVHMASINHPIIGDQKYGDFELNNKLKINHQVLCAYKIYLHQLKGNLAYLSNTTFEIELDKKDKDIIDKLLSN